jgi:hypothetical protein
MGRLAAPDIKRWSRRPSVAGPAPSPGNSPSRLVGERRHSKRSRSIRTVPPMNARKPRQTAQAVAGPTGRRQSSDVFDVDLDHARPRALQRRLKPRGPRHPDVQKHAEVVEAGLLAVGPLDERSPRGGRARDGLRLGLWDLPYMRPWLSSQRYTAWAPPRMPHPPLVAGASRRYSAVAEVLHRGRGCADVDAGRGYGALSSQNRHLRAVARLAFVDRAF